MRETNESTPHRRQRAWNITGMRKISPNSCSTIGSLNEPPSACFSTLVKLCSLSLNRDWDFAFVGSRGQAWLGNSLFIPLSFFILSFVKMILDYSENNSDPSWLVSRWKKSQQSLWTGLSTLQGHAVLRPHGKKAHDSVCPPPPGSPENSHPPQCHTDPPSSTVQSIFQFEGDSF